MDFDLNDLKWAYVIGIIFLFILVFQGSLLVFYGPFMFFLFFLISLWFIYDGTRKYLLSNKVRDTSTSKIRSAAVGLVELFGTAKLPDNLLTPISKQKCAYWLLQFEYAERGWHYYFSIDSENKFWLQDETGKILVDTKGAELDLQTNNVYIGIFKNEKNDDAKKFLPKVVIDFIESNPISKRKLRMYHGMQLRVSEFFLTDLDPVYVLGDATMIENVKSVVGSDNLIVKKGTFNKLLYISDSSEKKVLENNWGNAMQYIFGGLIAATFFLYLLIKFWMKLNGG